MFFILVLLASIAKVESKFRSLVSPFSLVVWSSFSSDQATSRCYFRVPSSDDTFDNLANQTNDFIQDDCYFGCGKELFYYRINKSKLNKSVTTRVNQSHIIILVGIDSYRLFHRLCSYPDFLRSSTVVYAWLLY